MLDNDYAPKVIAMPEWFRRAMIVSHSVVCVISSCFVGLAAKAASPDYRNRAIEIAIPCLISVVFTALYFRRVKHWSRWALAGLSAVGLLSYMELLMRLARS